MEWYISDPKFKYYEQLGASHNIDDIVAEIAEEYVIPWEQIAVEYVRWENAILPDCPTEANWVGP